MHRQYFTRFLQYKSITPNILFFHIRYIQHFFQICKYYLYILRVNSISKIFLSNICEYIFTNIPMQCNAANNPNIQRDIAKSDCPTVLRQFFYKSKIGQSPARFLIALFCLYKDYCHVHLLDITLFSIR